MPSEKPLNPQRNNLVERREFLSGAATLAGASFVGATGSSLLESTANAAGFPEPAPPAMTPAVERKLARWQDQRWLLDAVINTVGPEWDQGRLGGLTAIPGGGADAAKLFSSLASVIPRDRRHCCDARRSSSDRALITQQS